MITALRLIALIAMLSSTTGCQEKLVRLDAEVREVGSGDPVKGCVIIGYYIPPIGLSAPAWSYAVTDAAGQASLTLVERDFVLALQLIPPGRSELSITTQLRYITEKPTTFAVPTVDAEDGRINVRLRAVPQQMRD